MRNKVVNLDSVKNPIKASRGFAKKHLSDFKLDIEALCGFGCGYCSSNDGNFLRINRKKFADETERQLGERILPADDPALTFEWPDVIQELDLQLRAKPRWGFGSTLVFSMLTDAFSPRLVQAGTTRKALDMILERTGFRIRVLTKSATVGSPRWVEFFAEHADRFVVGLSIGTLDDEWAKRIEVGTSSPSARLRALDKLQQAGVPTYGMLCPVFPDVLNDRGLECLVDAIRPDVCERVWAEPYNDRANWQAVRAGYDYGSPGYRWMTETYETKNVARWSQYATELYRRLRTCAEACGWLHKLRYLLYEKDIQEDDAPRFRDLEGVLLQSKQAKDGLSQNPHVYALQAPDPTPATGQVALW